MSSSCVMMLTKVKGRMAFTEALRLVVDADTRGAIQGIEKLGATADRELGKSEKSLDKWGNRLTSLGTGMIAFGGAALVGLGGLAKASEEAKLAQVKMQNTIDNMPKLAGASASEFTDLAESIQKVTAADADAIVEAEALLGTFNLTAQEIKGITPLVVDYARKFGIDMADAAVQVGKALDGQSGALKRNGVSIDETLFATDRYRAVQEALSDQVGGFAEAEGKTFAGSLERMKNELGDLAEGVGGGAVDAFTTMFGVVEKVTGALEKVSPEAQNTIGKVATFGAVGLVAAGGVSVLIGQTLKAVDNFSALASGAGTVINKLGGLKGAAGMAGAAGAIVALAGAIELYNQQQQKQNVAKGTDAFLAAGESAEKMREVLRDLSHQGVAEVVDTFDQLAETNREAAERFIDTAEAAGFSDRVIRDMRDHLETLSAAEQQTAEDGENAAGSTQKLGGAMDDAAESTDDAAEAVQSYSDRLQALFDPLFGALDAQQQLADANAHVMEAEANLSKAIEEHGENSLEAAGATLELQQAQIEASEAALGQQGAMSALRDAVADGTVSIEEAKRKLQEWEDQGLITQASADTTARELEGVGTAAASLPGSVTIGVGTTGVSAVTADFANIKRQLDDIPRSVNIDIVSTFKEFFGGSAKKRQHGGPVLAGEAYVVGEKRPELFIPDQNGMILPAVPSMGSTGVGAGGGGVNVNINLTGGDQQLMEWLRRRIQVDHGGNVQNALGYTR